MNFCKREISLQHETPVIFVLSQWQNEYKPNIIYFVYRWLFALYFFITCILSIFNPEDKDQSAKYRAKWLIYVTYWSYAFCALQALIVAIMMSFCVIDFYVKQTGDLEEKALKLYKFYWVTNVISNDMAFTVTIVYWTLVYSSDDELNIISYLVHGGNSVMVLIDLFIVNHPTRLLHFVFSLLYALVYAVFSAIYYAAGGLSRQNTVFIYDILDWRSPGKTTLICLGVIIFVIVIHGLTWIVSNIRILLYLDCRKPENPSSIL